MTRWHRLARDDRGMATVEYALVTVAAAARTIDATRTSMPGKGQTYAGIYELDGDSWRWCVSPRKGERPTEFVTRKGQFLLVLKRQAAK